MDLIHGLADLSELAPDLGTLLTDRSRFFFKFLVSLIGRFFIADRIRFFFVDGLFFERPRGGKNRDFRLANRRGWPKRMLRDSPHLIVFLDKFFASLSRCAGPSRSARSRRILPAKFPVPVHRSRGCRT